MALYMEGAYSSKSKKPVNYYGGGVVSYRPTSYTYTAPQIGVTTAQTPIVTSTPAISNTSDVNNTPAPASEPAPTPVQTQAPVFQMPQIDLNEIWERAGKLADAEINPQLAEIDRQLQQAGYTADESAKAINDAYPIARRSLQKSIYENLVAGEQNLAAMGTGRGGGRQELLARAGTAEATGIENIENQKLTQLGAIQRALQNYQNQLGSQKAALAGNRGALQAKYAEALRQNAFNEAATQANIGLAAAQLAEQQRQFNENLNLTRQKYLDALNATQQAYSNPLYNPYNTGTVFTFNSPDELAAIVANARGNNTNTTNAIYNNNNPNAIYGGLTSRTYTGGGI